MDEVAEVKNRLDITEVVAAYLPLKQAGRNLKAPCPFHAEKTASFMVSPDKGIYHCFGCGEGGDIFSFVMKMEGIDFRETLEKLARQAGVELKARRGDDQAARRLRDRLLAAHQLAAKYYQASLVRNPGALEYATQRRHLTRQTVQDFQIGYAPDSWNALTDFLAKQGYQPTELLQAGLAGQKPGRSTIYDLFRARLMFPICDRDGRPVGFTGRVLDDAVPKYLNTPQTSLYDKSQAIFGLHLAKEAIRTTGEVVLVEGNMDVVASHQAGVRQVVAASGTALTSQQLKQLSGLTKKVILAFDSDRAGLAATRKAVPLAQKHGIQLYALELAGAKDADELIQRDPQLWVQAISSAKEIRDYWLERGMQEFNLGSSLGKRQFVDRMLEIAQLYASTDEQNELLSDKTSLDQDIFLSHVAEVSKIELAALKSGLKASRTATAKRASYEGKVPGATASSGSPRAKVPAAGRPGARLQLERLVLALALTYPLTRLSLDDLHERDFSTPEHQAIFRILRAGRDEPGDVLAGSLTDIAKDINILLLVGEQQFADLAPADRSIEAFELGRRLQTASNKDLKSNLITQLREADQQGNVQLVDSLTLQIQAINEEEV